MFCILFSPKIYIYFLLWPKSSQPACIYSWLLSHIYSLLLLSQRKHSPPLSSFMMVLVKLTLDIQSMFRPHKVFQSQSVTSLKALHTGCRSPPAKTNKNTNTETNTNLWHTGISRPRTGAGSHPVGESADAKLSFFSSSLGLLVVVVAAQRGPQSTRRSQEEEPRIVDHWPAGSSGHRLDDGHS